MNADLAHALVDRLYAAASEPVPERWQGFVEELSDALGGPAIRLVLQMPGFGTPARTFQVHLPSAPGPVIETVYQQAVPLFTPFGRALQDGFTPLEDVLSHADLDRGELAAEWLEQQELLPLRGLAHWFGLEDGVPVGIIAIIERDGCRALGPADRELCDVLAPHLACAYRLYRRLGGEEHERMALAGVMDRLPIGIVLLDSELRPVVMNGTADRILALDDGFIRGPDGLRAANARDDMVMQEMLSECVSGKRSVEDGESVMAVARPSGKRAFPLLIGRLDNPAAGEIINTAVVSLIFGDPEAGQGINPAALRAAYDLTTAESELVGLLAEGYSVTEAAENRGVSVNTVRTQLKHVFAKTETNRQGALIRFVLTGSASFPRSNS